MYLNQKINRKENWLPMGLPRHTFVTLSFDYESKFGSRCHVEDYNSKRGITFLAGKLLSILLYKSIINAFDFICLNYSKFLNLFDKQNEKSQCV
jgi:hypothetical protein